MKLIFNITTRRFMGTITGNAQGMPTDVILVDAPMPTVPETAYLKADNQTVMAKALTDAEQVARLPGGDPIRIEKQWAISEIRASDYIAPLKDHSHYYAYIMYRASLREYYNLTDFTGVERPLLDKTIKNSLTKFQFMSRFTVEERVAITTASTQSPALADWVALFKLTEEMNLNDPQTIAGVQMLEAGGIIGVGRANEILA